jgi:hypothetical protein
LGRDITAGATSASDVDDRTTRPTTADTLVANEDRDRPWEEKASVAAGLTMGDTADTTASGPAPEPQENKIRSDSLSQWQQLEPCQ